MQRVLVADVANEPVRALVQDDRLWRIEIDRPAFRTVDGLGVGGGLEQLLRDGDAMGIQGDGLLYVVLPRQCGVSFRLTFVPEPADSRDAWTIDALRALPKDTKVDRILITGCEG